MDKFNNQFATQKLRQEMSVTGTGASFTPGTGEQMATNKAFKKKPKKEEKDVEPKLAAGKAKVYPKEKWGWKDAPSIPNRPSKGGFIYKQLFEELSYIAFNHYRSDLKDAYGDLVRGNDPYAKIVVDAYNSLDTKDNPDSISKLDNAKKAIDASKNLVDQQKNYYKKAIDKIKEYLSQTVQEDVYEPEEQDDDEDRYDWFTDKYEPVSDYGKYRKDPDYYEKDYQEKGTGDYFQRRGLGEIENENKVKIVDPENKYFGRTGKVHDIHDDNTAMIIIDAPGNPTTTVHIAKLKPIPQNTNEELKSDKEIQFKVGDKVKHENQDWTIEKILDNGGYRLKHSKGLPSVNVGAGDLKRQNKLNENYSKFKNETKTRGKSDQFHQAIRAVRKKVQEINRLFEYVSRLKSELSEGEDGLKYKMHTEKALAKIKEMVSELNQNIKKFK